MRPRCAPRPHGSRPRRRAPTRRARRDEASSCGPLRRQAAPMIGGAHPAGRRTAPRTPRAARHDQDQARGGRAKALESSARLARAPHMTLTPIPDLIAELKAGRMVILVDDESRENEGDLIIAADCVTPEAVNFMAKHGRGLICMPITEERARQLKLPLMVQENRAPHGTAFTVSIEAASGVTTGISAYDRAQTIRV